MAGDALYLCDGYLQVYTFFWKNHCHLVADLCGIRRYIRLECRFVQLAPPTSESRGTILGQPHARTVLDPVLHITCQHIISCVNPGNYVQRNSRNARTDNACVLAVASLATAAFFCVIACVIFLHRLRQLRRKGRKDLAHCVH